MIYGNEFDKMTDEQKEIAIEHVLSLITHNGISKDTIIEMLRHVCEKKAEAEAKLKELEGKQ